jgi:hypothetical protein
MNYTQFKNKFQGLPIIVSKDALRLEKGGQAIRNQLNRWHKKGLIIKLKRGIYLFNKNDRKGNPSLIFVANQLYGPSYVSLEYALNYYDLIPERVADLTSVSTKKTMRLKNELGVFIYQHIKPAAFRGFKLAKDEHGLPLLLAEPEKAVVDFLYLNLNRFKADAEEQFVSSYRFQNTETLRRARLIELARAFESDRLMKLVRKFCNFIRNEAK